MHRHKGLTPVQTHQFLWKTCSMKLIQKQKTMVVKSGTHMPVWSHHWLMQNCQTSVGTLKITQTKLRMKPSMLSWLRCFWILEMMICKTVSGSLSIRKGKRQLQMVSSQLYTVCMCASLIMNRGAQKNCFIQAWCLCKVSMKSALPKALPCNAQPIKAHQFWFYIIKGFKRCRKCNIPHPTHPCLITTATMIAGVDILTHSGIFGLHCWRSTCWEHRPCVMDIMEKPLLYSDDYSSKAWLVMDWLTWKPRINEEPVYCCITDHGQPHTSSWSRMTHYKDSRTRVLTLLTVQAALWSQQVPVYKPAP